MRRPISHVRLLVKLTRQHAGPSKNFARGARKALKQATTSDLNKMSFLYLVHEAKAAERASTRRVEGRERRSAQSAADRRLYEVLNAGVMALVTEYTQTLAATWDEALLAKGWSLEGSRWQTWGNATVPEHQDRVELYKHFTITNAEDMALHMKAIKDLTTSGTACLLAYLAQQE